MNTGSIKLESLANPAVLTQPVYEPGKPIEDVARELGLDPAGIVKLASNENPFGPSPRAVAAARRALEHEIIELLGHVFLRPGDEVVMGVPAFVVYKLVTLLFGAVAVEVPTTGFRHDLAAMARAITPRTKLVFVASPNNPTGASNPPGEILAFARSLPEHVILVVDEAYAEYDEHAPDLKPLIREGRKVVGLRTFSKIYGLASLRVGYGYASAELAALLQRVRQPFNVNAIGQAAASAALDDHEFTERCVRENRAGLGQLTAGFRALGLEFAPSSSNFLLVKVGEGARWFDALQRRGLIVRPLQSYGLPEWLRITVGTAAQNERLLAEMAVLAKD